jgi:hypothetical protein
MDVSNVASIHQQKSKYRKFKQPLPPAAYPHPVPLRQLERKTPPGVQTPRRMGLRETTGCGGSHTLVTPGSDIARSLAGWNNDTVGRRLIGPL